MILRHLLAIVWHQHAFELRHQDATGERWLVCECGKSRPMLVWNAEDKRRRETIEQRIADSRSLLIRAQRRRVRESRLATSANVVPMRKGGAR